MQKKLKIKQKNFKQFTLNFQKSNREYDELSYLSDEIKKLIVIWGTRLLDYKD